MGEGLEVQKPTANVLPETTLGLPVSVLKTTELYPYKKGASGIPFAQILDEAQKSGFNSVGGEVKAGSGRPIIYFIDEDGRDIEIRDKRCPGFLVGARLKSDSEGTNSRNVLSLQVYTKPTEEDTTKYRFLNKKGRHPDFNASRFLEFILAYFAARGIPIDSFEGYWGYTSTNFRLFMDTYRETHNRVAAAENTWTVKKLRKLGFTGPIDDVRINLSCVTALVKKH